MFKPIELQRINTSLATHKPLAPETHHKAPFEAA